MLNRQVFMEGFSGLCLLYDKEPSKVLADIYYEALKGLTDDEFKAATAYLVRTNKYAKLPLPADFLTYIHGSEESAPLLAWHKVERAVRSECGSHLSPVFDDPVIHVAISRGFPNGWVGLCERLMESNATWVQKDFIASYEAYSNSPMVDSPPRLVGRSEATNTMTGQEDPNATPVFIGDTDKCLALSAKMDEVEAIAANVYKSLMKGEHDES